MAMFSSHTNVYPCCELTLTTYIMKDYFNTNNIGWFFLCQIYTAMWIYGQTLRKHCTLFAGGAHFMDLLSRTYRFLSDCLFLSRYTNYLEASKGFDDVVISQWRRSVSSNTSDATLFNSPSTLAPFLQMACRLISLVCTSRITNRFLQEQAQIEYPLVIQ